jgi:hypothetical protein
MDEQTKAIIDGNLAALRLMRERIEQMAALQQTTLETSSALTQSLSDLVELWKQEIAEMQTIKTDMRQTANALIKVLGIVQTRQA